MVLCTLIHVLEILFVIFGSNARSSSINLVSLNGVHCLTKTKSKLVWLRTNLIKTNII